ncbi:MAG: hypothetical protein ACYTF6_10020 [Planctomycetota bacterium]|jgi:hypothetical protein
MQDTQNIIIVLLLVTAAILASALVVTLSSSRAHAESSVAAGDYIMVPGAFSSLQDVLYVIDLGTKRMNVYESNLNKNGVDLLDSVEMDRLFRRTRPR